MKKSMQTRSRRHVGFSRFGRQQQYYYFSATVAAAAVLLSISSSLFRVASAAPKLPSGAPVYNESVCQFSKTANGKGKGNGVGNKLLMTRCLSHRSLGSYARWLSEEGRHKDALKVHKRSAALGNDRSQFWMAVAHAYGLFGLKVNNVKALLFLQFAALAGNRAAKLALGSRYRSGIGVPKRCATAMVLLESVANQVVDELEGWGLTHSSRIHADTQRHVRLSQQDIEIKNVQNQERAISYYRYMRLQGDKSALNVLGSLYFKGSDQVKQSFSLAKDSFEQAAKKGSEAAMANLGVMYLHGFGMPARNITKARELFLNASRAGGKAGKNGLGYMKLYGLEQEATESSISSSSATTHQSAALRLLAQAADNSAPSDPHHNLALMRLLPHRLLPRRIESSQEIPQKQGQTPLLFDKLNLGNGRKRGWDFVDSFDHFRNGAKFGNVGSMHALGHMHQHGIGVQTSCESSCFFYKKVAEHALQLNIFRRAIAQRWKEGKDVWSYNAASCGKSDLPLRYLEVAEMGIEIGESNAAWVLRHCPPPDSVSGKRGTGAEKGANLKASANGGRRRGKKLVTLSPSRCGWHIHEEVHLLRRSGFQGHADSYRLAGDAVFCLGRYRDSSLFYRQAADSSNGHAALNLGMQYQLGLGVAQDFFLAKRYFDMSVRTDRHAYVPGRLALKTLFAHTILLSFTSPNRKNFNKALYDSFSLETAVEHTIPVSMNTHTPSNNCLGIDALPFGLGNIVAAILQMPDCGNPVISNAVLASKEAYFVEAGGISLCLMMLGFLAYYIER